MEGTYQFPAILYSSWPNRILGSDSLDPKGMSGEVYLGLVSSKLILQAKDQFLRICQAPGYLTLSAESKWLTVHEKAHVALFFQMGSSPRSSSVQSIFLA